MYAELPRISIDYGVMEHAANLVVVPVECGWSDIGSWRALAARIPPDEAGNVIHGRVVAIDSRDCVLYADRDHVVAAVGVEGLVVAHTKDATLVIPAERAQQVREVVERLEKQGWSDYR